jgi:hypothetical protein
MTGSRTSWQSASIPAPHRDAMEARVALRIAGRLSQAADAMPHDVAERLRVARLRAIDRARELRKLSTAPAQHLQGGGVLAMSAPPSWWLRLASMAPLALLLAGLLLIQRSYLDQQIQAAAEIDQAILTDDLPPQAYSDPGFAEFLKSPRTVE